MGSELNKTAAKLKPDPDRGRIKVWDGGRWINLTEEVIEKLWSRKAKTDETRSKA